MIPLWKSPIKLPVELPVETDAKGLRSCQRTQEQHRQPDCQLSGYSLDPGSYVPWPLALACWSSCVFLRYFKSICLIFEFLGLIIRKEF